MMSTSTRTIVGFFPTRADAETAVTQLQGEGFSRDEISVVAAYHDVPQIGPLAATGGEAGQDAAIGGLAGFLVGLAVLAIPGVGPLIAAGPLAAALTGAAAGAATGGLIGAFRRHGVPEEAARRYSDAISSGRIMVIAHTDDARAERAVNVLQRCGAVEVDEPAQRVPASHRFSKGESLVSRQRDRERHGSHPGITGGGGTPTTSH